MGEAGGAVEYFGKAPPQFCIPVARQCFKMYKYAKFDKNIPCGSSYEHFYLLTTTGRTECSAKRRNRFAYQWPDNVEMY